MHGRYYINDLEHEMRRRQSIAKNPEEHDLDIALTIDNNVDTKVIAIAVYDESAKTIGNRNAIWQVQQQQQ